MEDIKYCNFFKDCNKARDCKQALTKQRDYINKLSRIRVEYFKEKPECHTDFDKKEK